MTNKSLNAGTIFITGIPVSGKSTLGKHLKENFRKNGIKNVKILDGEEIREQYTKKEKHFGYSTAERNKLALEIAHMAFKFNRRGIICIICSICHMKETREKMRNIIGKVMEVYLDCSVNICAQRDYKNHYEKALQGLYDNFVGVTEHYQRSDNVECVLHTGIDSIAECSNRLYKSAIFFLKSERNYLNL